MRRLLPILLAAACRPIALADGSGCSRGTPGVHERACFAWRSGPDLSEPIAAGSDSGLEVAAGVQVSVESSDPSVLAIDPDLHVRAGHPGTAEVIVKDSAGVEIDRATATVAPTVALATDVYGGATHLTMLAATPTFFHVSTVGPGDLMTVGVGAVAFSASGTAYASTDYLFREGDEAEISGEPGHGAVVARADHAVAALDIDFVDESAVTSIDLRVDWIERRPNGTAIAHLVAVAHSAAGPVYFAECRWDTSPAADVAQGVNGIDKPAAAWTSLTLDLRDTPYAATCAIGSQRATVRVSY